MEYFWLTNMWAGSPQYTQVQSTDNICPANVAPPVQSMCQASYFFIVLGRTDILLCIYFTQSLSLHCMFYKGHEFARFVHYYVPIVYNSGWKSVDAQKKFF